MDRVLIPQLTAEQLGQKNTVGWYMDELKVPDRLIGEARYPIFQSPCCNKRTSFQDHSIGPEGDVNASILCTCGKYHEFGTLDNWPSQMFKRAGALTVTEISNEPSAEGKQE